MKLEGPELDHLNFVQVRDVQTAYRRAGGGAPLLYLHGAGLTRRWLPIHEALACAFDVIAPEHPGFGDTTRPAWYRSIDDMAIHYADFLDEIGVSRVHLVGHSFGGRLAASFAALYPERVDSLALLAPAPLEPGGRSVPPPWEGDALPDLDELMFNGNKDAYPEFLDGDDEGERVTPDPTDPYSEPQLFTLDTDPALYRRLSRVNAPTVVVVPDEDRLIPRQYFEEWQSHLPGSAIVTVSGATLATGHLFIVQEPIAICEEVARNADVAVA